MSKINWEIVDRTVFAEFRLATTEQIAQAYLTEAFLDEPNNARLVSLYEIGQGRYSERLNGRQAREQLFMNVVAQLHKVGA